MAPRNGRKEIDFWNVFATVWTIFRNTLCGPARNTLLHINPPLWPQYTKTNQIPQSSVVHWLWCANLRSCSIIPIQATRNLFITMLICTQIDRMRLPSPPPPTQPTPPQRWSSSIGGGTLARPDSYGPRLPLICIWTHALLATALHTLCLRCPCATPFILYFFC